MLVHRTCGEKVRHWEKGCRGAMRCNHYGRQLESTPLNASRVGILAAYLDSRPSLHMLSRPTSSHTACRTSFRLWAPWLNILRDRARCIECNRHRGNKKKSIRKIARDKVPANGNSEFRVPRDQTSPCPERVGEEKIDPPWRTREILEVMLMYGRYSLSSALKYHTESLIAITSDLYL